MSVISEKLEKRSQLVSTRSFVNSTVNNSLSVHHATRKFIEENMITSVFLIWHITHTLTSVVGVP